MKSPRLFFAFLFASTTLLPAVSVAQNHASSASEAEIRHWMDDFKRAFEARDTKAVMALYAPDILAYDVIPPLQYSGTAAYTKDWQTYFAGYKGRLTLEYRDCRISASGDLAIFTCLERSTGTLTNGQPVSIWLRDTTALRRVNGRWLDFHDHVSVPADMETGKAQTDLNP
jgi:ketosteroid isomerase-like protein